MECRCGLQHNHISAIVGTKGLKYKERVKPVIVCFGQAEGMQDAKSNKVLEQWKAEKESGLNEASPSYVNAGFRRRAERMGIRHLLYVPTLSRDWHSTLVMNAPVDPLPLDPAM